MKVVVTDYVEANLDWENGQLQALGLQVEAYQMKFAPEEALAEVTRDADVIVVNMAQITPSLVARWERCELVIRHGIGYDNVDVDALSERGIRFINMPDYCVEEVAEHAIMLILAAGRKLIFSQEVLLRSIQNGQWDFTGIDPIFRLRGRKLGIIGCGRIGGRVYQKLKNFGFEFLICDPYLNPRRKQDLGIETLPLEAVLGEADFVTIHTPLNDETRHLFNERTLGLMKPSAYLINTARAGMVDQAALVRALEGGRIAGAALDVFHPEPPRPDDPLLQAPNVTLTPHLSWCSVDAGWEIRHSILKQIKKFHAGLPVDNLINRAALARKAAV